MDLDARGGITGNDDDNQVLLCATKKECQKLFGVLVKEHHYVRVANVVSGGRYAARGGR